MFSQIDKDHSQQISFEEFSSVFNQYDFRDVNDFGGKIVSDLKEIIRNNNLKLMDIFNNFDKDKVTIKNNFFFFSTYFFFFI